MIEVPHVVGVERNYLAVVHADGDQPILPDMLDGSEVSVGNAKLPIRRCEL
jgi:hypothetical protein